MNGRAEPTGQEEVIPCGLVIRSIGFRGQPLPGVPFDVRRGLIRNEGGRVCEEDGTVRTEFMAVEGALGRALNAGEVSVLRSLSDIAALLAWKGGR